MRTTVEDLLEWLKDKPSKAIVKVEINDTMETRLVVIPQFHEKIMGQHGKFREIESYEEGGLSRDTYDVDGT